MKTKERFVIALVTVPDLKTARKLARTALAARWAACVNLIPRLESHYWWQGRREKSAEVLLLIKTSVRRLKGLEHCVLAHHPYDTPEFVVLRVARGNQRYLDWWSRSLRPVEVQR